MSNNKFNVANLSLEEKIGQLLMFGFDGEDINDHTIELIKKYKAGNIILFTRNIKSGKQLFKLNQNLQKLAYENIGIPLFIGIDQEGGMVTRIQEGATFFPGAMTIAANHDLKACYNIADLMGRELKALGINMNFAPVLDVNNNPKNPVIGVRSFSDDPKVVSAYGTEFIKGLQNHVIATGKHFPGHGDTVVDSHLGMPKVDYDMKRLESIEFVPFKKAIDEGLLAIMSSHIDFPALTQNGLPTTLSKDVMTGLLRDKFKFEGLIVTDGMQMKAIADHYGTVPASLMAVEAGVNIYCICHSRELQIESLKYIKKAVLNKEIKESLINERVQRILDFKKLFVHPADTVKDFESVKDIVDNKASKLESYQIVENAATLVKGKVLKLKKSALFIGIMPKATSIADERLGHYDIFTQIEDEIKSLDVIKLSIKPTKDEIDMVLKRANDYNQVIMTTYNSNVYHEQIDLINELTTLDQELHVISMRNPYDLYEAKNIKNYVCLYEYTPNSIEVLLKYLKGKLELKGKVPVKYE